MRYVHRKAELDNERLGNKSICGKAANQKAAMRCARTTGQGGFKMATLVFCRWYGGKTQAGKLRKAFYLPTWLACFIAKHSSYKQGIKWRDFAMVIENERIVFTVNVNPVAFPNIEGLL